MSMPMNPFKPVDAALGGLLIGCASGFFMLLTKRIAGNSGVLKGVVIGSASKEDAPKVLYLFGMIIAGIIFRFALPEAFDAPLPPTLGSFGWGIVTGIGTTLGNGCTSGHGLCGLSRFSLRSLVAVPTFMVAAIATSTISTFSRQGNTTVVLPAPPAIIEQRTLHVALVTMGVLAVSLTGVVVTSRGSASLRERLGGLWCGLCAGAGLTIGGMVRPSVVVAALSPARVDFTLWELFMTALLTTFILYRLAHKHAGVTEACAARPKRGDIDAKLLLGAVLFGIGWGASGFCPGPLIVVVASNPTDLNALLCLLGIAFGMQVASHGTVRRVVHQHAARICPASVITPVTPKAAASGGVKSIEVSSASSSALHAAELRGTTPPTPPPSPPVAPEPKPVATAEEMSAALADPARVLVDVRAPVSSNGVDGGVFRRLEGALTIPCDKAGEVPLGGLPTDKAVPIIVTCKSGNRAGKAAAALGQAGYTNVLNGGGPHGDEACSAAWESLTKVYPEHTHALGGDAPGGGALVQLFDGDAPEGGGSSTLTYILADTATKEAIIIDPVLEQVERDLEEVEKLGATLVLALNTHCHADHITGTGELKKRVPGLRSAISAASGAKADVHLKDGQVVSWANGARSLTVLPTPGHTNGCISLYEPKLEAVFTGDALLIGGCGRTDFQEGSAETLYDSVHSKLFKLPPKTIVYPAHDYKGRRCSSITQESTANPRMTKSKTEFVELMANLGLPYPKKIDASLPANLVCGIQD